MKKAEVESEGIFMTSSDSIRLIYTTSRQASFKYVKGAEMSQEQPTGDFI